MSSPAERYAASKRQRQGGPLTSFTAGLDFALDPFQIEACEALASGHSVLVAAPTGAGKTIVGEFAVFLALAEGRKCFYTTPIKALSNQKYSDLVERHGAESVGLLTGDIVINGEAPVVVMTTEVLRNMLYAASPTLEGLGYVVMDEVHYLADRDRGAVWEEVILHLTASVRLACLSATVSNAEEFAEWLQEVRGETHTVVEEHRPVPLWQHVLVDNKLIDLYVGNDGQQAQRTDVHPRLLRLAREESMYGSGTRAIRGGYRPGTKPRGSLRHRHDRADALRTLDAAGLLPAITFIFSRAGCDAAVEQCLRSGLRLTTDEERSAINAIVDQMTADLPQVDLMALGFDAWADALQRGLAAHHAGLLPRFKEVVEALFVRGLVKAVFATETLALGINMPARSVVLERLTKFDGNGHADITPGEYTQLTGRAGRRGIDVEGHAVVVWQPGFDPVRLGGLASTRTYPLRSSFRPTYTMSVSLVRERGSARARELLESSFAQFQADRAVVGLARQSRRSAQALAQMDADIACERGDVLDYIRLTEELKALESKLAKEHRSSERAETVVSLQKLRVGDVIEVPSGRRAGLAIVLDPGLGNDQGPRPLVLTAERQAKRLSLMDFSRPVEAVAHIKVPKTFNHKQPQARRDLASHLRTIHPRERGDRSAGKRKDSTAITDLRQQLHRHPVHNCPDKLQHLKLADRRARAAGDVKRLEQTISARTDSIARRFDRICKVLTDRGFLDGEHVTADGIRLAALHTESDLLLAEAIRAGAFDNLDSASLAAVVSALVFEGRGRESSPPPPAPAPTVHALHELVELWSAVTASELKHKLPESRQPDPGMVWSVYRWATGAGIGEVLREGDVTPGDFVRTIRQVIDLLGQIATATAPQPLSAVAREGSRSLMRGVIAYAMGVVED